MINYYYNKEIYNLLEKKLKYIQNNLIYLNLYKLKFLINSN